MKRSRSKRRTQLQTAYRSLWERFLVESDPVKRAELRADAAIVRQGFARKAVKQ